MTRSSDLNFAFQDLRNCSFRDMYLRDADFSHADLRGCDFRGANLIGANFTGVQTGRSDRQVFNMLAVAIAFPVMFADAIAFALSGNFTVAVAISLAIVVIVLLTVPFMGSLAIVILATSIITGVGNLSFAVGIAVAFSVAIAMIGKATIFKVFSGAALFSLVVAIYCGFAGDFVMAFASPYFYTVALTFAGIVTFTLVELLPTNSMIAVPHYFMLNAAIAGNLAIIAVLGIAVTVAALPKNNLLAIGYIGLTAIVASGAVYFCAESAESLKNSVGTSFREADLSHARFTKAQIEYTDFSGAKVTAVAWHQAKIKKCIACKL